MLYEYEIKEKLTRPQVPAYMPVPDRSLEPQAQAYLSARGLDASVARHNHWYPSRAAGDCAPRIVMPATNRAMVAYWQARLIADCEAKRYTSPPVPRADSIILCWPKRQLRSGVVLVEGPMDALAAASVGSVGVALMGVSPSFNTFEHLAHQFPCNRFIIVPDADALDAGLGWSLSLSILGRQTTLLPCPVGIKDLAEMSSLKRAAFLEGV
jgi:hypothetical protein